MSNKAKGGKKTSYGSKYKRDGVSSAKKTKKYRSKGKDYTPKIYSPYGVSPLVRKSGNKREPIHKTVASNTSGSIHNENINEGMTYINLKNGKKVNTKALRNLNDIKNIKNNKVVCNNVMVNVEGCYDSHTVMDDIPIETPPELSTNDVEGSIIRWIIAYGHGRTILGMMAWLSNERILECLIEHAKRVLFIVNDDDYTNWRKTLTLYDLLPKFEEPLHSAFFGSKSLLRALDRDNLGNKYDKCTFETVRCFGNASFNSKSVSSLMHNKVMIFCDEKRLPGGKIVEMPTSFINGSFNFTGNAPNNIENACWINSKKGAENFLHQFSIIMSHSRPIRR